MDDFNLPPHDLENILNFLRGEKCSYCKDDKLFLDTSIYFHRTRDLNRGKPYVVCYCTTCFAERNFDLLNMLKVINKKPKSFKPKLSVVKPIPALSIVETTEDSDDKVYH